LLDADVAATRGAALQALMTQRLTIAGDGAPLAISWGPFAGRRDRRSLRLPFTAGGARPPAALAISAALFPYDDRHQTFVNVYDGRGPPDPASLRGRRHN